MAIHQGSSQLEGMASVTSINNDQIPHVTPAASTYLEVESLPLLWSSQAVLFYVLSILLLSKVYHRTSSKSTPGAPARQTSEIPALPNHLPFIGHVYQFIQAPQLLARAITDRFGKSGIVRLNFITTDAYHVSGAEYINAVLKDNKALASLDALNFSIRNMFNTPLSDMAFFKADRSGITLNPHPQGSSTKPEDRVFHHVFRATADFLSGPHLPVLGQRFRTAINKELATLPIQENDWVEKEDFFTFLRPLIMRSTIATMCGPAFLIKYPDFVEDFVEFNNSMVRFVHGWPRFLMPRAWRARERCISVMRDFRRSYDERTYGGSGMFPRRWSRYSKMEGLSEYGVACSDLGILWGGLSNGMPSAFWLIFHTIQDPSLLSAARAEIEACRLPTTTSTADNLTNTDATPSSSSLPPTFDTAKLTSQPLLQSLFAETLRKYIAVYTTRQTKYSPAQILNHTIPQDKLIMINSAIAHTDERNWNSVSRVEQKVENGDNGEEYHPVTEFWGHRFLVPSTSTSTSTSNASCSAQSSALGVEGEGSAPRQKFSLDRYRGAWIPFGGGIHQCPARHWIKTQMLLSLAVIVSSFEIEVLCNDSIGGKGKEVEVDVGRDGLGALYPAGKVGFRIRKR